MTSQRLFIRAFMMILWVLLTGGKFTPHPKNSTITNKSSTESIEAIQKATDNELKQPLDLSIPFKAPSNNKPSFGDSNHKPKEGTEGLFVRKSPKKESPFQLKGHFISSPEPEIEKHKSVDGAGIIFNIKD